MKVRDVLTPLLVTVLRRLCSNRELPVGGTKNELLKRLAYSYRGNVRAVLADLPKEELLGIARAYSDALDLPSGMRRLPVADLRELLHSAFTDAPEGRQTAEPTRSDEDSVWFDVELYSAGGAALDGPGTVRRFDLDTLRVHAAKADAMTVVSGYYVPGVLQQLLSACSGKARVVLNGLGGRRLTQQVEELEQLQEALDAEAKRIDLRLAFAEGVFHTKLYLFESGSETVAWIGSANATRAGLGGHNEEILVRVSPAPRSVMLYAESAWQRAVDLERCRQHVNSLPAFFRTGTLYYPPYVVLQKTLNPFSHLLERLPTEDKRKISVFHSDFADDEAGIGAFNLNRVFEQRRAGSGEVAPPKQQVRFRRFAVETCYGYWVPEALVAEADRVLDHAASGQRALLETWREWLSEDIDSIMSAYSAYLDDAKQMLEAEGVNWKKYASPTLFEETDGVMALIDKLVAELGDEDRLRRHIHAFVPTEVPEIWEDARATRTFEESFFGSLAISAAGKRRSAATNLLLMALGFHTRKSLTAEDIREALELQLRDEHWYEENLRSQHRAGSSL